MVSQQSPSGQFIFLALPNWNIWADEEELKSYKKTYLRLEFTLNTYSKCMENIIFKNIFYYPLTS